MFLREDLRLKVDATILSAPSINQLEIHPLWTEILRQE